MTINEAMVLQKAIRERLNELKRLRDEVAVERTTFSPWGETSKKIEEIKVKFDIKVVDRKVVELELFLFKLDAKIKQANAVTKIDIEPDVDKLLAPLE